MKLSEVRRSKPSDEHLANALREAKHKFRLYLMELVGSGIAPGHFKPYEAPSGDKFFKTADLPALVSHGQNDEFKEEMKAYLSESHGNLKMVISYTALDGLPGLNAKLDQLREFGKKYGATGLSVDRSSAPSVTAVTSFNVGGI